MRKACARLRSARRSLLYLPLLVTLVPFVPGEALAKGGTNSHEMAAVFPGASAVSKTVSRTVGNLKHSFVSFYERRRHHPPTH